MTTRQVQVNLAGKIDLRKICQQLLPRNGGRKKKSVKHQQRLSAGRALLVRSQTSASAAAKEQVSERAGGEWLVKTLQKRICSTTQMSISTPFLSPSQLRGVEFLTLPQCQPPLAR